MTMRRLIVQLAGLIALLWTAMAPAQASVTITFWSHEFGSDFPHAFFTLRGVPDDGGPPVDANWGFTARAISPALLFGPVPGRLDIAKHSYMEGSTAQFSVTLTDAQYRAINALVYDWGPDGNSTYDLNHRNCVTFVQHAAEIVGLKADFPNLMKKPRSFLLAVAAANPGKVTMVSLDGKAYFASLSPLVPDTSAKAPVPTPVTARAESGLQPALGN